MDSRAMTLATKAPLGMRDDQGYTGVRGTAIMSPRHSLVVVNPIEYPVSRAILRSRSPAAPKG